MLEDMVAVCLIEGEPIHVFKKVKKGHGDMTTLGAVLVHMI